VRLFVAVWPSEAALGAVAALPRPEVPGVRWTRRTAWHVTLRFLGEVDDPAPVVTALERASLEPAWARLGPRSATFGRRVLILPVAGLDALTAGVDAALRPPAFPERDGAFRGHLTVARARRGASVRPLAGTAVAAGFAVDAVVLVRSRPGPGGHTYEVVHQRRIG